MDSCVCWTSSDHSETGSSTVAVAEAGSGRVPEHWNAIPTGKQWPWMGCLRARKGVLLLLGHAMSTARVACLERACHRDMEQKKILNCSKRSCETPLLESVSELYQPSGRRLSAKLVPTFADRGWHVVSVTDPYDRILGFLDRGRYVFLHVTPQLYSRGWVDPIPDPLSTSVPFTTLCLKFFFTFLHTWDKRVHGNFIAFLATSWHLTPQARNIPNTTLGLSSHLQHRNIGTLPRERPAHDNRCTMVRVTGPHLQRATSPGRRS
jgi:hypothetical protein